MYREIIFKGKTIKNTLIKDDIGVWVEGDLTRYSDVMSYINVDFLSNICCSVDAKTVSQYIGYTDCTKWKELSIKEQEDWLKNYTKNDWYGKKIFENDIIIDIKFPEIKYVVKWSNLCFTITPHCDYNDFFDMLVDKRFKVIGNIIDNPEIMV